MPLPTLPRELQLKIMGHVWRDRAATRIQAVWRGRDVRDWLQCPWSEAYNTTHPRFVSSRLHCAACTEGRGNMYLVRKGAFESERTLWAWSVRRPWITYCYAPHGNTLPFDGSAVDFHVFYYNVAHLPPNFE